MNDKLLMPGEARQPRADAVKNRALLLETAQRLFDEQGLENVSMTDIAEAAGVGKGTLYRHFRSKSDLAFVLLDQDQRDLQARALRRFQNQGDPGEDLRWFLEQAVRFVERNEALLCVAAQVATTTLSAPAHLWWRQSIRGLLLRAQIPPTLDVDYVADMLYVMIDAQTIRFQRRTLGYETSRILEGIQSLLSLIPA